MLLTFDVFCCCREQGCQSTFSLFFSSFRKTEQAWKIKQSFLPPHPLFPLNSTVLPQFMVFFFFKENTFTGIDKKKKIIKETGQNESMDDAGEGYWTGIRDWLDHGFGQKGRRWMVSFRDYKLASTQGSWKSYRQGWLLSKYWDSVDHSEVFWSQVMCGWGYVLAAWSISI